MVLNDAPLRARPAEGKLGSEGQTTKPAGTEVGRVLLCTELPARRGSRTHLANQADSAFRAAARRLLWRAALFLWMIFLSAMLSMVDTDCWKMVVAAALSPAWMALRTALIAVRRVERCAELCA